MIVVAHDQARVVHVTFYSLTNDTWQLLNAIVENNLGAEYDVSISGKTALVGFYGIDDSE